MWDLKEGNTNPTSKMCYISFNVYNIWLKISEILGDMLRMFLTRKAIWNMISNKDSQASFALQAPYAYSAGKHTFFLNIFFVLVNYASFFIFKFYRYKSRKPWLIKTWRLPYIFVDCSVMGVGCLPPPKPLPPLGPGRRTLTHYDTH